MPPQCCRRCNPRSGASPVKLFRPPVARVYRRSNIPVVRRSYPVDEPVFAACCTPAGRWSIVASCCRDLSGRIGVRRIAVLDEPASGGPWEGDPSATFASRARGATPKRIEVRLRVVAITPCVSCWPVLTQKASWAPWASWTFSCARRSDRCSETSSVYPTVELTGRQPKRQ